MPVPVRFKLWRNNSSDPRAPVREGSAGQIWNVLIRKPKRSIWSYGRRAVIPPSRDSVSAKFKIPAKSIFRSGACEREVDCILGCGAEEFRVTHAGSKALSRHAESDDALRCGWYRY